MKIFNAQQIKELDSATIALSPMTSVDLMERASQAFVTEFNNMFTSPKRIGIFCGTGNNGGDGLAIARLLLPQQHQITCYVVGDLQKMSPDASYNFKRLQELMPIINLKETFNTFEVQGITIDALFGTGLNRPLSGIYQQVVNQINQHKTFTISVDIPSGMYTGSGPLAEDTVIAADVTLSFQSPKLSFLLPEYASKIKSFKVLDIQLHRESMEQTTTAYHYTAQQEATLLYKPRNKAAHKGNFGNALIIGGSYGMIGAAALATKACLRAGAGKTTVHVPQCGYEILQTALPEAMVKTDINETHFSGLPEKLDTYDCIGIGPGLGTHDETVLALRAILTSSSKPLVIDADALNSIATELNVNQIPKGAVITPHPKEFERLFGVCKDHLERIEKAIEKAKNLQITIVLKGAHTTIISPEGQVFFNSTGNAGLAKGGSGDVLTGIITALICQKYEPTDAAILGVYLHGLTADLIVARQIQSLESLVASDLCDHIHLTFEALAAS